MALDAYHPRMVGSITSMAIDYWKVIGEMDLRKLNFRITLRQPRQTRARNSILVALGPIHRLRAILNPITTIEKQCKIQCRTWMIPNVGSLQVPLHPHRHSLTLYKMMVVREWYLIPCQMFPRMILRWFSHAADVQPIWETKIKLIWLESLLPHPMQDTATIMITL